MENERELATIKPAQLMRIATDVAGTCKEIVRKTAVNIAGKHYVRVEGWQSIATAHGCIAGSRDVEKVDGGFRAIGEIRRQDNGALLATAEGFVGNDEKTWSTRDEYAKRAMAQTRAISRACRSAFAHVVVLMDAGLETTPFEEMPHDNGHEIVQRQEQREARDRANAKAPIREIRRVMSEPQTDGDWRNAICTYGKKDGPLRGKQLGELTDKNIEFLNSMFLTRDRDTIDAKDLPLYDALVARKSQAAEAAPQAVAVDSSGDPIMDNDEIPFN